MTTHASGVNGNTSHASDHEALHNDAETLNRLARALTADLDLQVLVQIVTDAGVEVTGAKFGAFFYNNTNDAGKSYLLYTLSGAPREAFEKFGMPRVTEIFGPTFAGKGPVRIDDVRKDSRYGKNAPNRGMPDGHLNVTSYLAVSVVSRSGEVLGGLFFGHPDVGVFDERAERMALGVAAQAAVSIDNANLYAAARRELEARRAAELARHESEVRFRELIQTLPVAMYTTDAQGKVTLFNEAAAELWGRSPEIGKELWSGTYQIYHPDGTRMPLEDCPMARCLKTNESVRDVEIVIERPDGTRRHVLPHPQPLHDAEGNVVGAVNMLVDLTSQNAMRKAREDVEQRLGSMMAILPAGMYTCDANGRITYFNKRAAEIWGREPQLGEALTSFKRYFKHSTLEGKLLSIAELPVMQTVHHGTTFHDTELHVEREDGTCFISSVSVEPIRDGNGQPIGAINIFLDISARKATEQALRESENRFRSLAMNAPTAIFIKDLEGRYTLANKLARAALGQDDVIGMTDHELMPKALADVLRKHDLTVIESGKPIETEEAVSDGAEHREFLSVKFPLLDNEGNPTGVCGVAIDITERRQAEAALRAKDAELDLVTNATPVILARCSKDLRYRFVNRTISSLSNMQPDEMVGKRIVDVIGEAAFAKIEPYIETVLSGERVEFEVEIPYPKVGTRHVRVNYVPEFDSAGDVVGWVASVLDISERRRAEDAVRESESRFRNMADYAPVLIFVHGPEGCEFVNREYLHFLGRPFDQVRGLRWLEYVHPDDRESLIDTLETAAEERRSFEIQHRFLRSDGEYRWLRSTGVPRYTKNGTVLGHVGCSVDITEQIQARQTLERQSGLLEAAVQERTAELEETNQRLRLAERMASLGTLSAGLGHDIGNILIPVRVRLESLASADLPKELHEHVDAIRTSSEYLHRLSTGLRMLAIDPKQAPPMEPTMLSEWWVDAEPMLRNALPRGVKLGSTLPKKECWVAMSRAALTQVVFNLVQNAGEATRNQGNAEVHVAIAPEVDFVRIDVTDNGPGMSDDVKQRCLEPFFTTKARGFSTGLGLSLIHRLVQDANGTIDIKSELGQGTQFSIRLRQTTMQSKSGAPNGQSKLAAVILADARLQAFVASELRSVQFDVVHDQNRLHEADLIVINGALPSVELRPGAAVLHLNGTSTDAAAPEAATKTDAPNVRTIESKPQVIRKAIREFVQGSLSSESAEGTSAKPDNAN